MLNLHSHSRADLSRNHKVIDELTAMVEQSSAAALTRSDRKRLDGGDDEAGRELVKQVLSPEPPYPYACHGANQAHDAGVESFQGQFEGEEQ